MVRRNLVGEVFNYLTVVKPGPDSNDGRARWWCKCKCGNPELKLVDQREFTKKDYPTDSCGCLKKARIAAKAKGRKSSRAAQLVGEKFHQLTVKKRGPNTEGGQTQWWCECDCNQLCVLVRGVLLTSKKRPTKSCGCHQKQRASETQFKDITGETVGYLKVLKLAGKNKNGQYLYQCKCKCGELVTVLGSNLRLTDRPTESCGCLQKERASEANKVDLTGERFGRLTCISPLSTTGKNGIPWECECDCGKTAIVPAKYLTLAEGGTKSCGCLAEERDIRICLQFFIDNPEEAVRSWNLYLAEVANVVDKIGIAADLKNRMRSGEFTNYWWTKSLPWAESWCVEQVALQATEHWLPEEPYYGRGTGPTEQRTGWVLDEIITMMEDLINECQADGWELFYKKYFPHT